MLRRHAGLIIKFELNATVWFGSAAYFGAKMTQVTRKANKFQKVILCDSDCVFPFGSHADFTRKADVKDYTGSHLT